VQNTTVGDRFYSLVIANGLLRSRQYALTAMRCRLVSYSKARFISLVGLNQISLGIGESKCRIMAGLPMKSAFAGFKKSLFHALLRVYEGDFGY
jgi:hypothetical protein